jgi:hypothetical protein
MINDILNEVRRNRDAFSKQHKHDLQSMADSLRKAEKQEKAPVIDRSAKASRQDHASQPCHLAVHETPVPYQAAKKKPKK